MDFQAGNVVRLRSGGPKMTLARVIVGEGTGDSEVECKWFADDNQLYSGVFRCDSLKHFDGKDINA
jgi:uncharacterized protein YodC (DUF2158 family)